MKSKGIKVNILITILKIKSNFIHQYQTKLLRLLYFFFCFLLLLLNLPSIPINNKNFNVCLFVCMDGFQKNLCFLNQEAWSLNFSFLDSSSTSLSFFLFFFSFSTTCRLDIFQTGKDQKGGDLKLLKQMEKRMI